MQTHSVPCITKPTKQEEQVVVEVHVLQTGMQAMHWPLLRLNPVTQPVHTVLLVQVEQLRGQFWQVGGLVLESVYWFVAHLQEPTPQYLLYVKVG